MTLLGVDVGSTHCKAALFAEDGTRLALAAHPLVVHTSASGERYFDPEEVWTTAAATLAEVAGRASEPVAAIGIASMAETGLLVEARSGAPRSPLLPWFDTTAQTQADQLARHADPLERFCATGLRPSFKCALAKIMWLHERDPQAADGAVWLGAADYIAHRLTGAFATDPSLAGRTFAFRVDSMRWDSDWLRELSLPPALFPRVLPSGEPMGRVLPDHSRLGLRAGTPVAVAGHDHVCAAFGAGATEPGLVLDSLGTAEVLLGALPERPLTAADFDSGLMFGRHTARGRLYWMGGLSASGGSVEWLRGLLNTPPLTYAEVDSLLASADSEPGTLLYFPYLLGSGSPHSEAAARGAFVGLAATTGRAHLLKAALEGAAYEIEFIRRVGQRATGQPIDRLIAAGGGTRNRRWLQIKADVSGCPITVAAEPEAALLGAALLAGVGSGVYASEAEAQAAVRPAAEETYRPEAARSACYERLYENGFIKLQTPLREYYQYIAKMKPTS